MEINLVRGLVLVEDSLVKGALEPMRNGCKRARC